MTIRFSARHFISIMAFLAANIGAVITVPVPAAAGQCHLAAFAPQKVGSEIEGEGELYCTGGTDGIGVTVSLCKIGGACTSMNSINGNSSAIVKAGCSAGQWYTTTASPNFATAKSATVAISC